MDPKTPRARSESIRTIDDIVRFEQAAPFEARMPARSVYDLFAASAARFPDRPALTMVMTGEDDEAARTVSYRDLLAGITRAANLFAELGGPGAGVAFILPSLIETQLTLWGAEAAGYGVPINFLLHADHVAELVRASGAKILVALGPHPQLDIWQKALRARELIADLRVVSVAPPGPALAEGVISLAEGLSRQSGDRLAFGEARGGDAVAAYFHTGGTTGAPKLVSHTHRSQIASAFGSAVLLDIDESDVLAHGLPIFHVGGAVVCNLTCVVTGAHALMMSPGGLRNPLMVRRYWRIVERYRATIVGGVPTSVAAIAEVPVDGDLSSVRFAIAGAALTPRAVAERFEACTGKPLHEIFGMTEASGAITIDPAAGTRTIGSAGLRLPYTELCVRKLGPDGRPGGECSPGEVGILSVRGPHLSPGYRDPAQGIGTFDDGWLETGDLVYRDEAGKLFIAGRSKDLIIRGGHNLDPAMIEEAFTAHPAVALAAAVGEPDAYAGELPVCYVALRPGASTTADELHTFVEARIAERAAWPKRIHLLPELPLTAVGKIYKPALRADAARRVAEDAVSRALGHAPEAITAEPGGPRGMKVTVTLAAGDSALRGAVESVLGGYLFEAIVR
jgi:fatty-acyl-CoA synthase